MRLASQQAPQFKPNFKEDVWTREEKNDWQGDHPRLNNDIVRRIF
jgi:hypothetical protein